MRPVLLAGLVLLLAAPAARAAQPRRPPVDLSAMREAMGLTADEAGAPFPSAASYAHFLRARLAHHEGNHREALDELRLALASDDANPYLMTELAEQLARSGELERAEAQLRKVLERHDGYAPAQLLMGRVLSEGRKITRARVHLGRAIKLRPHHPDAYLVLTQLWLEQGKVEDAVRVVEELGAAVPGEPIGYHRLGLALAERGDLPRAERLLLRAVERDPGDHEAWITLARIFASTRRLPRALEALDRAVERDPDNGDVLLEAGQMALRLRRVPEARAYFAQALSLSREPETAVKVAFSFLAARQLGLAAEVLDSARAAGGEPRLHFYAGLVHERLRAWPRAAEAFAAVPPGLGDFSAEARVHLAQCLSLQGQHRAAIDLLRKLQAEGARVAGLEPALSRALERAGQVKEAEVILITALGRLASSEVLDALGGFFARQRRLDDAATVLAAALARAPTEEALRFTLANVQVKQGDWVKAVETIKGLLAVDPEHAGAHNFIGYTLAQHGGDLAQAERAVRRALELKPDTPAFLDTLGWVLFKRGDAAQAVDLLERAVDDSPDDPTLLEHLGLVSLYLGRTARALEVFSRALQLLEQSPDDAERPFQRADIEDRVKMLSSEHKGR